MSERPRDWPGLHSARALTEGEPTEGYWFSRTLEYAARQRGETFDRLQYATRETVTLSPLPCWKDLSADARRARILSLIDQIETEAANRRAETGAEPLGVAAILGQHPHHRPRHLKKSPAPLFHAISQTVRRELYEGYAWFVAAFRQAAEKLKAGDRSAAFPTGSFPPALPFVGDRLPQAVCPQTHELRSAPAQRPCIQAPGFPETSGSQQGNFVRFLPFRRWRQRPNL